LDSSSSWASSSGWWRGRGRLACGSAPSQELADFLNSEAGSRLLEKREPAHPSRALGAAVTAGVISLFVGLAFLLVVGVHRDPSGGNLVIPGLLFVMAGLGILLSALISAWLFRRAGLLSDHRP
jgi:vacuolar-type H+-ATPase subunit I/STV1